MKKLLDTLLQVLSEYKSLDINNQIDYKKFYLYSLITHSTAIEGSTVTEIENQLLFDEGISVRGRSMTEQLMNLDLKNGYEESIRLAKIHTNFGVEMLKQLSAAVMKNTGGKFNTPTGSFDASKGDLRLVNVTAGAGGKSYLSYQKVPSSLEEFCKQTNEQRKFLTNSHNIAEQYLHSFDAHYQLVTIHPWIDGNGRMARLIMNHLQFEYGLVPTKINKDDKAEYIRALVDSRESESLVPFRKFMLEQHIKNLQKEIADFKKSEQFDPIKTISDPIKAKFDPIKTRLLAAIKQNGSHNYAEFAKMLGVSEATIKRRLNELKAAGSIKREGSNKTGCWKIQNS